jgi:2-dehydro-3-deoxygluconokinase
MSASVDRLDVITAGEAMALFAAQQPGSLDTVDTFTRSIAGAELNVAIGLARLGCRVAYVTRLGNDSFGRSVSAALAREGIDTRWAGTDPAHPTGFMLKSKSVDGSDPTTEYFRRGSAASRMVAADVPADACRTARHLHLSGVFAAVSPMTREFVFAFAAAARAAGLTISFDPNLRPSLWPSRAEMIDCLNRLAALADWVLPGLDEGLLLTGQDSAEAIAGHYLDGGARGVVVKLGADGAYFATRADGAHPGLRSERGRVPGVTVPRVVDTVGAGDGFAVGVISALLEGASLAQAALRGNRIGARVVQFPGDSDGLPTRAELQALENAP